MDDKEFITGSFIIVYRNWLNLVLFRFSMVGLADYWYSLPQHRMLECYRFCLVIKGMSDEASAVEHSLKRASAHPHCNAGTFEEGD